jgi:NADP-reducing hydrogenase subunit HndD
MLKKMKKITLTINGKKFKTDSDKNLYQVAKENKIYIPGLCGHPDFPAKGNCRICLVELSNPSKGIKKPRLVTSCTVKAEDGMVIKTESERVKKSRNLNIELIFAQHVEKCPDCVWKSSCPLLKLAEKYKISINKFPERKNKRKTFKFANAVEIDGSQCIDCRNCLDACNQMQKINYLKLEGKGIEQEIVPVKDKEIDCIYCGQCAVHCPVGSAQEQTDWEKVEKIFNQKNKILIAQFAPSVRVSLGEEFGMDHGKIVTGQIVSGLKELGFEYVFDVNFGADLTTMVEAEELLERFAELSKPGINKKSLFPMLTSCCPAWVKYLEFYQPDLIPNLTTSRSPQIHLGGAIKTYWAEKNNLNPKNIITVSIMPCTSKKFEASRPELKINGNWPVDYVLTTRELAYLLKKNRIDFPKLKSIKSDNPLGEFSGAAAIYGGSGGVMESALRTAQYLACGGEKKKKNCRTKLDFTEVRGFKGIKEATVDVAGAKLKIAVVNGIGNVGPVLENISQYDYIEVMACPGGCIGGGGQPIPTTPAIRQKRIEALYRLDKNKKLRKAHENKGVNDVLKWLDGKGKLKNRVLHTYYKKRK